MGPDEPYRITEWESRALRLLDLHLYERHHHHFVFRIVIHPDSPWLVVTLDFSGPIPEEDVPPETLGFAIWRRTGAVYEAHHGEVDEDPIIEGPDNQMSRV